MTAKAASVGGTAVDIEERNASCFIVMDANRFPVCYVYFVSKPGRRSGRT